MVGFRSGVLALLVTLCAVVGARPVHAAPGQDPTADDPAYSVDLATLDAALDCDPFTHPDREPVLLVHGTFTMGHEQYDWNYALRLRETGHDVCIVTYPGRGLGDMQISAEYIARAVQRIAAESGSKVDMVGHSQGALMPRWAIRYWPSVRAALDDFVMLAGPNHGTSVASGSVPSGPPVFFQFSPGSAFIAALNDGDETPGDVDYTSVYTRFDELVQPVDPVPTAALDLGQSSPRVANILIQDLCPLRVVDHLTIGTTDRVAMDLVLDALDNDGPAEPGRLALDTVACALPDQYLTPATFTALVGQFEASAAAGFPELELTDREPPLRSYAVPEPTPVDPSSPEAADPIAGPASGSDTTTTVSGSSGLSLPTTGQAIPILAASIAIGVALLLRAGKSRLDDPDLDDPGLDGPDPDGPDQRPRS